MANNGVEEEIVTKESIDRELLEKQLVDDRILDVLNNIELILIVGLVCLMVYITFKKVSEYLKRKQKEQHDFLEEQQRNLMRDYEEKEQDKR